MLALYRCGRQAEALEVYQEFRRACLRSSGSTRARACSSSSWRSSPAIPRSMPRWRAGRLPSRPSGPPARRPGALGPRSRRIAVGASARGRVAVAAVVVASTGGGAARFSAIAADSVGAISPAHGAIRAVVPVGSSPSGLAAGDGACG